MRVIDNAGYKDLSGIRRIPIARVVGKGGVETVVVGNDAIDRAGARIRGKPYMDDATMYRLFDGSPLVVEEKVDGHPVVILHGGYTFFCEQLTIQHSVSYEQVPYSLEGWPDMTVVYDVLDGEFEPRTASEPGRGCHGSVGRRRRPCATWWVPPSSRSSGRARSSPGGCPCSPTASRRSAGRRRRRASS